MTAFHRTCVPFEKKKNRTFRPHTFSNFTNIENNLDYVTLSHSVDIHYVYLSHPVHKVYVYLSTSLNLSLMILSCLLLVGEVVAYIQEQAGSRVGKKHKMDRGTSTEGLKPQNNIRTLFLSQFCRVQIFWRSFRNIKIVLRLSFLFQCLLTKTQLW